MSTDRTTFLLTMAVAIAAPLVIATSGGISYSSLYELALKVGGYGQLEAHLFPFPIDLTLGGAVAASFLLARWRAPMWPRFWIALQVALSAVVTISGNALHGTLVSDAETWAMGWRLAVSAVPGAAIVGMTHTVTIMLRSHPRPDEEREERAPEREERGGRTASEPPANRRERRSLPAPKESRVRALLDDGGVVQLDGEERAALIARVATEAGCARSYVRKIAGRVKRESEGHAPEAAKQRGTEAEPVEERGSLIAIAGNER